jgi:alpha,alpha-trehalase
MMHARKSSLLLFAVAFLSSFCVAQSASPATTMAPTSAATATNYDDVLAYIHTTWDTLTRNMQDCSTIVDPKVPGKAVLYVPQEFEAPAAVTALQQKCNIKVQKLPVRITRLGETDLRQLGENGLLYLPNPYVVPGGRFNEMYGWDSYFTIVGLLADGRVDLARGMVENFFFEVEHYGAVLNANRSYYLTRSQPPFLTTMINDVWQADRQHGRADVKWLERAYQAAVKDHDLWTRDPHLAGTTTLARYFDFGQGPVPEESDTYRQVAALSLLSRDLSLFEEPRTDVKEAVGFELSVCPSSLPRQNEDCEHSRVALSRDYYKGDRSMRESGYDISFRFGPFGSRTHHFAAADLNSLLYKTEVDLAAMATELKHFDDAAKWGVLAKHRQEAVQRLMWNEHRGMFFDYDIYAQKQSTYEFLATFYPLWAGLATKEQAQAVARNVGVFEQPGGLATSPYKTGVQWDYPYVWAPPFFIAVEGLRRYGFNVQADRLTEEWMSTVAENFRKEKTIREKYNAETRTAEAQVIAGYQTNVVGFGWTNGVFAALARERRK